MFLLGSGAWRLDGSSVFGIGSVLGWVLDDTELTGVGCHVFWFFDAGRVKVLFFPLVAGSFWFRFCLFVVGLAHQPDLAARQRERLSLSGLVLGIPTCRYAVACWRLCLVVWNCLLRERRAWCFGTWTVVSRRVVLLSGTSVSFTPQSLGTRGFLLRDVFFAYASVSRKRRLIFIYSNSQASQGCQVA